MDPKIDEAYASAQREIVAADREADHVRVVRIAGLHPGGSDAVNFVSAVPPLADDALEISPAGFPKQGSAAAAQIVHEQQAGFDAGHDRPQPALAFDERPGAQVLTVDLQQIEGAEVRPVAAEQQLMEPTSHRKIV